LYCNGALAFELERYKFGEAHTNKKGNKNPYCKEGIKFHSESLNVIYLQ